VSVTSPAQAPCLVATDLTKTFSGNIALDSFSIEIMPGQVHALVGHNGSGKSTFIKMLAGYYVPDSGRIVVDGQALRSGDPTSSAAAGLSFVHQTLGLVPALSVLENLHLGKPYDVSVFGSVNWGRERAAARAALERFGSSVDPRVPVARLTTVEQVEVAIVRALGGGAMTVLVLDEPTAALTDQEVRRLFATIRRITAQGVSVIYISHRLEEIPQIADVVTVLSDGRIVERGPIGQFDVPRLVALMSTSAVAAGPAPDAGKLASLPPAAAAGSSQSAGEEPAVVLTLTGLTGQVLRDFNLEGRAGEIVGVVGLLGSGLEELVAILAGRQDAVSGRLEIRGRQVSLGSLAALAARGLRVVIGDKSERIVPDLTAGENATLSVVSRYYRDGVLRLRRLRGRARQILGEFGVLPADPALRAGSLSGGNQQKLAVAKALQPGPDILVLEEPFHGVDVRGRSELSQILRAQTAQGRLILIIDSDLDEITGIATKIIVLRDGSTVLVTSEQQADKRRLLEACYGGGGQDL
jgi:ribose transport system ATP-binding protein